MVKTKGILFVTAILALSCTAFPTSEELLNPAEPESPNPTDLTDPSLQTGDVKKEMENGNNTKENESEVMNKESEIDMSKVYSEEVKKEDETLNYPNCQHYGSDSRPPTIVLSIMKLPIRPSPFKTVMYHPVLPLKVYGSWYGGYGTGYGEGYANGLGYGLGSLGMYDSPLVHFPFRKWCTTKDWKTMDKYKTKNPAIQNNRRELAANGKIDLTVANKEGTPDDLAPPTREGNPEIALTEEELSELARCGFRGFGGGFNRPIILPIQGGLQPSVIDVNFASRGNGLNTNRPAIDWLTLLRLLG